MADAPLPSSDDRTRAALAAVRAEAFHVAAAQVSDALLVTVQEQPGEHVVAWVNDAFERLTGWPADDILGRSPGCLIGERPGRRGPPRGGHGGGPSRPRAPGAAPA